MALKPTVKSCLILFKKEAFDLILLTLKAMHCHTKTFQKGILFVCFPPGLLATFI